MPLVRPERVMNRSVVSMSDAASNARSPHAAAPEHSGAVLDLLSTPLAIVNGQGRVLHANAALIETYCERRLSGTELSTLAHGEHPLSDLARRVAGQWQRLVARRVLLELRRDAPKRFDVAVSPIEWRGEAAVLFEFHALAEHDQDLGEGVDSTPEPAAQQMARALAHEIKNPLAGLHGAAQLLERELPSAALKEYTQVIRAETDRIRRLVDRLLQRPEVAHAGQSFNIHEVLERVRTLIGAEAGSQVQVLRDYDPSLPDLDGHPDRLTQAVLNLARNALQSGAGTIRLRTRAERRARIGDHTCKLALRIDVCDDGPGVPEDLRESLFLPFVTGRDEGTGLGLPVALGIAREHGGTLAFVSRPGSTVFSLLIPVTP